MVLLAAGRGCQIETAWIGGTFRIGYGDGLIAPPEPGPSVRP